MLRTIVKVINVGTAVYFSYIVGSAIYEMGKEAGKKEAASEAIPVVGVPDENGNPAYKVVDGVLYMRVDKK